jgi:hypothetical protein
VTRFGAKSFAAGILATLAAFFTFGHKQIPALADALRGLLSLLVPLWVAGCACVAITTVGVLLVRRRLKSAAFVVFTRVGPDNSLERLTERSVGLVTDQPSDVYELFVTLFE